MAKVILKGYILVPEADLKMVKAKLIVHSTLTIKEAGCIKFEVTPDVNNPYKFNVYEEFVDQIAFDNHQTRIKNSTWGKVTNNVKRHYQISSV